MEPNFPISAIRRRFGAEDLWIAFRSWLGRQTKDFDDLLGMLDEVASHHVGMDPTEGVGTPQADGYVYLLKSGDHYKIGRSDDIERRVKEVRTQMPESLALTHTIKTDDPSGIERYWHDRFKSRRVNGEWFRLTRSDISAFKRRKFQ